MASSSFTPSQSVRKIEYDVFLSFRGKDTRKIFVDFLFKDLKRKSIRTFKDDVGLKKGKCITTLLNIIKETRFAIVVFSKDYASSKWCLEEIATIMECQETYGEEILIPIFYDVEPSVVSNQTKSYAKSFKKHEKKKTEKAKVKRWKEALKKAGEISGYHIKNEFDGYLAECLEKVTECMFTRVNQFSTDLENNFVGLESRVEDVAKLVRQEPDKVEFIGIWGMRGIGKTTIAMTVFNKYKYLNQFEGAVCVEKIANYQDDISNLQKHLLNTILQQNVEMSNGLDGTSMMKRLLQNKKVLIVLDDVNKLSQLEKLAGDRNWFGKGSRVIITTTDEKVLRCNQVDKNYIYKVNKLDDEEATELFCLRAFGMKIPKTGFDKLCRSFVLYAKGLPLALKLLGSNLRDEDTVCWEGILDKLKDPDSLLTPKDEINEVLKISFEGLDDDNKNVFLHIACFCINWREKYVQDVFGSINLRVLIDKSLISVENGRIEMHGLIQEMGWRIARMENPRRRVWQFKDVQDVVRRTGHHHIEGMSWREWDPENINRTFKVTLRRMTNLKMLKVGGDGVNGFNKKINCLPRSLRWLEYELYHFPSLPQGFELSNLVGLSLRKSSLSDCNFITKELSKLTILDLSSSSRLLCTPDFDKLPNLMKLNLSSCKQLEEIHQSIGNLKNLIFLNLSECSNLKELPSFNQDSRLESLDLAFCKKIENFPEIKAKTPRLVELDLRGVGIIQVPPSIQQLDFLTKLSLDDCEHLASLPKDLCELKNLKILTIKNCRNLKSLPENLEGLKSLEYLNLQRSHFDSFPESFSQLTSLQYLDITKCQNPSKLPKLPANIRELYADCSFKIALAVECSELYSVSYSDDDNPEVGTFLSEEFIHRETPLLVSYLITAAEKNKLKMNQMLRSFKYRRYQSNGISIHLNSPWYSQKFVGFLVCFLCLEGDIWGPHSYQDIDQSMKHSTVIAKFSHKDGENEVLPTNCVIAGLARENDDVKGHVCFAFIPFRSLCGESKAIKDYSRFEVQFINFEASADWGCSLLYERVAQVASELSLWRGISREPCLSERTWVDPSRTVTRTERKTLQTGAIEQRYRHNGSDSGLTTDDIACLTLMELGETEYLNLNRLNNSPHLLEYCSQLHRLGLRYFDISGCQSLEIPPTLPSAIREVYAHSNLASESIIAQLASKYSELYSVSFSHKSNKAELNLSAEKLAKKFAHLPSQSRNSPFIVTYPTLTDIDTKRWFKYSSRHSNKVSINLNPSWYRPTFVGFVVHFLLEGRLHTWKSHPDIRPFRHCEVIAKLIHKDNGNPVEKYCKIGRLYDEEFDFNEDEFMIWFAYIPFRSLSIPSAKANDYSVFEVAFRDSDSKNLSYCSCGLLYKKDKSLSEAIRRDANDLDEEAQNTEHSIEEASMATTQPGAIIGENPRHSNIKKGKEKKIDMIGRKIEDHTEHSGGDDATSEDNSDSAGCTTDIELLSKLEYLNLSLKEFEHLLCEDISRLCHLQYLDISGCTEIKKLPELPATIRELYATYDKSLVSASNIAELATKYSELYNVAFSYPIDGDIAFLELRELVKKFIPITKPFLNRNTPFVVTYPPQLYTDYRISGCFKYPNHDPHHINPHNISISLDSTWYRHNFVGFVVCFVFPRRQVTWESHQNIPSFRQCQLVTKLKHKDNRSEPPPLQTKCLIGYKPSDEKFDDNMDELVCFAYIPFNSLWPKSKTITDNITPNHYLVFEAAIPDFEMSRKERVRCPKSKTFMTDIATPNWSCDLLYTEDTNPGAATARTKKRTHDPLYQKLAKMLICNSASDSGTATAKTRKRTHEPVYQKLAKMLICNPASDSAPVEEEESNHMKQRKKAYFDKGKALAGGGHQIEQGEGEGEGHKMERKAYFDKGKAPAEEEEESNHMKQRKKAYFDKGKAPAGGGHQIEQGEGEGEGHKMERKAYFDKGKAPAEEEEESHWMEQRMKAYLDKGKAPATSRSP